MLTAREDVAKERLIQPHRANRPAAVVDRRFEDFEAGTPRRSKAASQNPSADRRRLTGFERRDRLQAAAIFVSDGKAIQEIFDRLEAGALEIGRAARSDALQILQRRREERGFCRPLLLH